MRNIISYLFYTSRFLSPEIPIVLKIFIPGISRSVSFNEAKLAVPELFNKQIFYLIRIRLETGRENLCYSFS